MAKLYDDIIMSDNGKKFQELKIYLFVKLGCSTLDVVGRV